ncbi:hypothetical protein L1987_70863 [Smallanthus sonchifolius]|uniref:Uncharacterized protein n=1 Tax=Smallanthus sonchifolius TaxID=185202 RepID=A0ACB9AQ30_9ASTR|nr:hypothetical protein L1987_70863 [Smallanthus sonchifolius]
MMVTSLGGSSSLESGFVEIDPCFRVLVITLILKGIGISLNITSNEDRPMPFLNMVWASCGQVVATVDENNPGGYSKTELCLLRVEILGLEYIEQFGDAGGSDSRSSFEKRFAKTWESRKIRKIVCRHVWDTMRRCPKSNAPFDIVYFATLIGGGYDLLTNPEPPGPQLVVVFDRGQTVIWVGGLGLGL